MFSMLTALGRSKNLHNLIPEEQDVHSPRRFEAFNASQPRHHRVAQRSVHAVGLGPKVLRFHVLSKFCLRCCKIAAMEKYH